MKITNYRKNGQKFQNLVSLCPVYDSDKIYRYVIGVQFEIMNNFDLGRRLVQLNGLIHLLPSSLPLKSRATARTNGVYARNFYTVFFYLFFRARKLSFLNTEETIEIW